MSEGAAYRTPIDPSYPSCVATYVTLRVYTGNSDPHDVARSLSVTPDRVSVRGEVVINSIGRRRQTPLNAWFLSSERKVESLDARDHLDWMVGVLRPRAAELAAIRQIEGLSLDLVCTWWSRSGHGGPTLWPRQMRALADLDLELAFEMMFAADWQE